MANRRYIPGRYTPADEGRVRPLVALRIFLMNDCPSIRGLPVELLDTEADQLVFGSVENIRWMKEGLGKVERDRHALALQEKKDRLEAIIKSLVERLEKLNRLADNVNLDNDPDLQEQVEDSRNRITSKIISLRATVLGMNQQLQTYDNPLVLLWARRNAAGQPTFTPDDYRFALFQQEEVRWQDVDHVRREIAAMLQPLRPILQDISRRSAEISSRLDQIEDRTRNPESIKQAIIDTDGRLLEIIIDQHRQLEALERERNRSDQERRLIHNFVNVSNGGRYRVFVDPSLQSPHYDRVIHASLPFLETQFRNEREFLENQMQRTRLLFDRISNIIELYMDRIEDQMRLEQLRQQFQSPILSEFGRRPSGGQPQQSRQSARYVPSFPTIEYSPQRTSTNSSFVSVEGVREEDSSQASPHRQYAPDLPPLEGDPGYPMPRRRALLSPPQPSVQIQEVEDDEEEDEGEPTGES